MIPLLVIVAIFIVIVLVAPVVRRRKSQRLKQRFGPEYDRAVLEQKGDYRRAEVVLAEQENRVRAFPLRALSAVERETYAMAWMAAKRHFVDDPSAAVGAVDELVNRAMTDRGYPKTDFEQRVADISVNYATVVQNYRLAHEIMARHNGHITTEELRQAMVYYQSLFDELLEPAMDAFFEPAWDELFEPARDQLLKQALEPAEDQSPEPAEDELLEPAKIEMINGKGRRVTRERAS